MKNRELDAIKDKTEKEAEINAKIDQFLVEINEKFGESSPMGKNFVEIVDTLLEDNYRQDIYEYKRRKIMKYTLSMVCAFIVGVVVALVPTILSIQNSRDDVVIPLHFTPNAIAGRKPVYLQMINTPEQLEAVKKTKIYLADEATIGAGIRVGTNGLDLYLKRQLDLPDMHVKNIGPQEDKKMVINGYIYIPDAILTKDPTPVQILENERQVKAAEKMDNLTYKQNLEVGSAIECPEGIPCYAISKKGVQDRLIVKPLKSSKP